MFVLKNRYDNSVVNFFTNYQDAINWICDRAEEWNYGVYRAWPAEGGKCFDVGPEVYILEEIDDQY